VVLIIDKNDYRYPKKLGNAVANSQTFRRFQVVYRENANRRPTNGAMEDFIGKRGTDAIYFVYYSGHGAQINIANYLVSTYLSAKMPSDFAYDETDLAKLVIRASQAQAKFSLDVIPHLFLR